MQPNKLSESLKNAVCKARGGYYYNANCPYHKIEREVEKLYKTNKNSIPATFWREICDFKIPCQHKCTLDDVKKMASEFILFNESDYENICSNDSYHYRNSDFDTMLTNQLKRKDFNGFPLVVIKIKCSPINLVNTYLDKINAPIDKILECIIDRIDILTYDNSSYTRKPTNIINFVSKNIDSLDKEKHMNVFYLVCMKYDALYQIFDQMIKNGFIPDGKCLEIMMERGHSGGIKKLLPFDIPITGQHLKVAKNEKDIALLFKSGYVPNQEDLLNACKRCDDVLIKNILDYRIPISKDHFRTLVVRHIKEDDDEDDDNEDDEDINENEEDNEDKEEEDVEENKKNEELDDEEYDSNGKFDTRSDEDKVIKAVEILIRYGYALDYDDIMYACKNRIAINNIERFNIVPDKNLFEVCKSVLFLPNYKFTGVTDEEFNLLGVKISLLKLLNSGYHDKPTIPKIKKIIGKNKLVIDDDIMSSVFVHDRMYTVAEYLISLGGKINEKCYDQMLRSLSTKDHKLIANGYKNLMNDKVKNLEDKVKKLEEELSKIKK